MSTQKHQGMNDNEKESSLDNMETMTKAQLFEEFYSGVTLHGFRFLFERKNWIRKLIWFMITTTVFTFSVYLFEGLLSDFLERKTTVANLKVYQEIEMDFPTITICPLNTQSKKKLENLPANYTKEEFLDQILLLQNATTPNLTQSQKDFFADMEKAGISSHSEFLKSFKLTYDEMMETDLLLDYLGDDVCYFYNKYCYSNEFKTVIWRDTDLCMQFNPYIPGKKSIKAPKTQDYYKGFSVNLDLMKTSFFQNSFLHGVLVIIDKYDSPHQHFPATKYVTIPPGQFMFIKVTEHELDLLPPPYETKCGEVETEIFRSDRPYFKSLCMIDCIGMHAFEKCGCVGEDMKDLVREGIRMCKLDELQCYMYYKEYYINDAHLSCHSKCPSECIKTHYSITKSSVNIGNEAVFEYIKNTTAVMKNKTIDEIQRYFRNNMVALHISFFDNVVMKEKMAPAVVWTNLVSSVGGCVGLGLGFSFITAFEFLFFIFDYIKLSWKQRKITKKTIPIHTKVAEVVK